MGLCVSTMGYTAAEVARYAGLGIALGLKLDFASDAFRMHAEEAIENFKKLSDISDRGLQVEEQQHAHLRGVYWPAENRFLSEFNSGTPWDSQAVLAERYAGWMWPPIAAAFAKRLRDLEVNRPRYGGKAFKRAVQEIYVARAAAKANATALAGQIAFAEVEAIRDRDFERRKQAIGLRRGLIRQAASLMSSAANGLAAAGADAAAAASSALGFAGQAIGDAIGGIRNGGQFHAGAARVAGGITSFLGSRSTVGNETAGGANVVVDQQADSWVDGTTATNTLPAQSHTGTHGPFHATNLNEAQFAAASGGNQNLARGGQAFVHFFGVPIPIMYVDLSGADLGPVDHYMPAMAPMNPALPTSGVPIIGAASNTG